ncbi:sigma-70 family RNA polymerase sigma factor [Actinocorallia longicatena]|uniref:RNA polymerase sigma-70 region 2 domain-containing protein n=1 Tax=Actinocorallia longicatena TaxID=111803 RepID=A0ABP6QI66_9ACTN
MTSEDAELTRLVRVGDDAAAEELYRRHHTAVLAFAGRLCRDPLTAEDLASEAFTRTLRAVRTGASGPSGGWRPYLYAVARNTAAEWARGERGVVATAEVPDLAAPEDDPPDDLAVAAYRSLPERWRTVLWHTLIEREKPEDVARLLGTTPGNVNVLAFRAREGLRTAYLAAHVNAEPGCREFADRLAVAVRRPAVRRPPALRRHLKECEACARADTELRDLNATLRAALPLALPLLKGPAFAWPSLSVPWAVAAGAGAVSVAVAVAVLPRDPAPVPRPVAAPPNSSVVTAEPVPEPSLLPKAGPVEGTRIRSGAKGWCVGADAVHLPCDDRRTAWRRTGTTEFRLVNAVTGRCLAAAEKYDSASFDGVWAVRSAVCGASREQLWKTPGFSDGIRRLTSVALGKVLSERWRGSPTDFVLYFAYTGSAEQEFTL